MPIDIDRATYIPDRFVVGERAPMAEVRFMEDVNKERFLAQKPERAADVSPSLEIKNKGPIKSMTLPADWEAGDVSFGGLGARALETFHPKGNADVEMSVFFRGVPVDDASARAFRDVLRAKPAGTSPEPLTVSEIKSLTEILGRNTVGDNQHSNGSAGEYPPAFDLKSAHTFAVNGRTVLLVQGRFVDVNDGMPPGQHATAKDYVGTFIDTKGDGKEIQELFLEATPGRLTAAEIDDFKKTLKTITW